MTMATYPLFNHGQSKILPLAYISSTPGYHLVASRTYKDSGSSLFCVGSIRTLVDPERFAVVNQEAGITRFARPSALIPFLA